MTGNTDNSPLITSKDSPPQQRQQAKSVSQDGLSTVDRGRGKSRGNSERPDIKSVKNYDFTSPRVGTFRGAPPSAADMAMVDMEVLTPYGLETLAFSPVSPVKIDGPLIKVSDDNSSRVQSHISPAKQPKFVGESQNHSPLQTFDQEQAIPFSQGSAYEMTGRQPNSLAASQSHSRSQSESTYAIGGLDTLFQPGRLSREMEINFIKLDEYVAGAVPKRSRSFSPPNIEHRVSFNDTKTNDKRFMYYSIDMGHFESRTFAELGTQRTLHELLHTRSFWIDVCNPTVDEMKLFGTVFNIHPLTIEDIMTDGTREKFELYKSYYFICYCAFDQDPDSPTFMQSFNVYILIFPTFILSFHYFPFFTAKAVVRRLDQLKSYMKITPHWINYAILDDITDSFSPLISSLEQEVDSIDDLVLVITQSEHSDMLRRMANARKRVTTLQRLLVVKSDVLRVLMKRIEGMAAGTIATDTTMGFVAMLRDTMLYLGDVQDHVITMVQSLSHNDATLNRCHSNYLAQVNIEITQTSHKSGKAVAKLTALASILIPLNIITGLWGMNVTVPGETGPDNHSLSWFFGILTLMILIVLVGFATIRWMGLFGDDDKS